jgi:hypothetical protein
MSTKKGQIKNKRSAKKAVGAVQTYHPKEIWQLLLYVRKVEAGGKQLANRPYVAEGIIGSLHEIRFKDIAASMLSLQHQLRREWRSILRENAKGNRAKGNEKAGSRQKGVSESNRTLSQTNSGVRKFIE